MEEEKSLEEEQIIPSSTPVPATYTLFEEKPYLQLLKEKLEKFDISQYFENIERMLDLEKREIEEQIMDMIINLLIVANEDLKLGIENEIRELSSINDFKAFKTYYNEHIKNKIPHDVLHKRYRAYFIHLMNLYNELQRIHKAINQISHEKERGKRMYEIYKTLIEFLEIYPKHLRMGNLDPFEVKALRYIADTYFTLLSKALVFNNHNLLQKANFIILPLIINIQETSLSKDAFFLRLVHSAPLIPASSFPQISSEEGETSTIAKAEVIKEALKSQNEQDTQEKKESLLRRLIFRIKK